MNGTKIAAAAMAPLVALVTIMIVVLGGAEAQQNAAAATCPASPPANNPTTTTTTAPGTAGGPGAAPSGSTMTAPPGGPAPATNSSPAAGAGGYQVLDSSPSDAPTIMGPNTLNESQLADWYGLSHPQTVNGAPITQVITLYLEDGQAEGVRGDIAFVQATHETGYFTSPDTALDNFAGIGHPSGAVSGIPFGGVGAGVLAHIQLLKEAADGNNAAMVLPKAAPPWGGAQVTTWSQLTGTWATDPLYWPEIESAYSTALKAAGLPGLLPADAAGAAVCTPGQSTGGVNIPANAPANLAALLNFAAAQLGKPYQLGGSGPNVWDCSGLVQAAYATIGVNLPRTTYAQYLIGTAVPNVASLQAGDLIFLPGSDPGPDGAPGHVGIYDGNGGVINAPYTGQVVRVDPLSSWIPTIDYMRRIVNFTPAPAQAPAPGTPAATPPAS